MNQETRPQILVVDDTLENLDILISYLKSDYKVQVAVNGETALQLAAMEPQPDLIVLDILMPGMNGYDVCSKLKESEQTRDIPVIFATAIQDESCESMGLALGAVDFVRKPFDLGILKLRIRNQLELKKYRDRLEDLVVAKTAQLESAKNHAVAGDRAKSEFLSVISHELRTPLNGIIGFSNLLIDTPLDSKQKEMLNIVLTLGYALSELVSDIIDFVRSEGEQVRAEKKSFLLAELVNELVVKLAPKALEKGVEFKHVVDFKDTMLVRGDRKKLFLILKHLLVNAVKFTHTGSVFFRVERKILNDNSDGICFFIQDTGVGIPKEKQEIIFQRFTQLEPSKDRRHGGLGLGLTICRQYTQLLGGDLKLESVEGQGTRVSVTFLLPEVSGG
ncbi:MAG: ATP-binding protein [Magnetococcus sp. DMHC-6]